MDRGHEVRNRTSADCSSAFGVCQLIARDADTGLLTAASDPRKGGAPAAV